MVQSNNAKRNLCLAVKRISLLFGVIFILPFQCKVHTPIESGFKKWAITPPMGWNSWDCFGSTITEQEVKLNADYMAEHLKEFGWNTLLLIFAGMSQMTKTGGYNETDPIYNIDNFGRYIPAVNKFPSSADGNGFKSLANYIHRKGLKFGIHTMRGIPKVAVEKKLPVKGTKTNNCRQNLLRTGSLLVAER